MNNMISTILLQENVLKIQDAFGKLMSKLESWVDSAILILPNLVLAIVVFIFFLFLANLFKKGAYKLVDRFTNHQMLLNISSTFIYILTVGFGIFFALDILQLDKTLTSLLAGAGVIGLALSFAFQNITTNFVSGVIIVLRKPISVGDLIKSNDHFGNVIRINIRATHILTPQGQFVIIPNKEIIENPLINYSKLGMRRIDLKVGVSYGENLRKVRDITLEAVNKIDYLAPKREVDLFYEEFGDSSINFVVRYWVDFKNQPDYLHAVSDGIILIKEAYDENGITIPFPIRTLDFGIKGGTKLEKVMDEHSLRVKKEEG